MNKSNGGIEREREISKEDFRIFYLVFYLFNFSIRGVPSRTASKMPDVTVSRATRRDLDQVTILLQVPLRALKVTS